VLFSLARAGGKRAAEETGRGFAKCSLEEGVCWLLYDGVRRDSGRAEPTADSADVRERRDRSPEPNIGSETEGGIRLAGGRGAYMVSQLVERDR